MRSSARRFTSTRFGFVQDAQPDYDETAVKTKEWRRTKAIKEDDQEDEADYDDDGSSSSVDLDQPRLKSSDVRGQLQSLRDENDTLRMDFDMLQDKYKSLEDDLRSLQLQNKAQKLEIDTLNRLVELNKQAIIRASDKESSQLVDKDIE